MNYTDEIKKNQKVLTKRPSNAKYFKADRNLFICDLRAQGESIKEIQKALFIKYGDFLSHTRIRTICEEFTQTFKEEGLL